MARKQKEKEKEKKKNARPALTLGPLLYHWSVDRWRDFYLRIAAEAPIDAVCLGEVVCAKRVPFVAPVLAEVVEALERAGKEVVFSTLALVMDERDREAVQGVAAAEGRLVEANDVSAVELLRGRPHAVGPFVNVYNEGTLAFLAKRGAVRVTLPGELSGAAIAALARARAAELEVQVFGRLPLALSARCYHARALGLNKDGCRYACAEDADGMEMTTLDGEPFLAVNGTQTLSSAYLDLVGELAALAAAGVERFRLSPQDVDMVAVAHLFRDALDGIRAPAAARRELAELCRGKAFCDGFHHGVEGVRRVADSRGE